MEESISDPSANDTDAFRLGEILGERKALGMVAGRCSAAHAEALRRLRDEKYFKTRCGTWSEFCPKYLGMSKVHANRIIRTLEELGPGYFELAELTRITPEQFRAIAPSVKDRIIHSNGEAIALIPENADRIAAAVQELRRASAERAGSEPFSALAVAALERRLEDLAREFARLTAAEKEDEQRTRLATVLRKALDTFSRIEMELGIS